MTGKQGKPIEARESQPHPQLRAELEARLWRLSDSEETGMSLESELIPMRQETWEAYAELAQRLSTEERPVSVSQVAAAVLETALQVRVDNTVDPKELPIGFVPDDATGELVLSELELSTRCSKVLSKLGIRTVGELVSVTPLELEGTPGIGERTMQEIENKLGILGLRSTYLGL